MKALLLGTSVALAAMIAGPAMAAEILLKAPPPPPVYSWTGFYVGGNIGYGWGNAGSNYYDALVGMPVSISESEKPHSLIGGGQIGYNWQANNTWVLGIKANFEGPGGKGSSSVTEPFSAITIVTDPAVTLTDNADIQWFGTVGGVAGVLVTPTILLYGTGGLAYGGISVSGNFFNSLTSGTASFSDSTIRVGWTLGAGIEGAIPNTSNWTWELEYLYIDFGTLSGNGFTSLGEPYSWNTHVTDNILLAGFNYRFDWGGPIATKY